MNWMGGRTINASWKERGKEGEYEDESRTFEE